MTLKAMFVERMDIMAPISYLVQRDEESLTHFESRIKRTLDTYRANGKDISVYLLQPFMTE